MPDSNLQYGDLMRDIKDLEADNHLRQQIDKTLVFLSHHGWEQPRESFFHSLARFLAETLQMDYVCIDKLEGDHLAAETLAVYFDGKFEDNVVYTLKDTPCGDVLDKNVCCFTQGVRHIFHKDIVLQEMGAESYLCITLIDSLNKPIGLIAVIGRKPLENSNFHEMILKMTAVRASGELERLLAENQAKEREMFLRETGKIAKVGGWKINIRTLELSWSKEVFQIHELDEDFIPTLEKGIGFYSDTSKPVIRKVLDEAFLFQKPFDEILEIITAKHKRLDVRAKGNIKMDSFGHPEFVYGIFQDITEQKQIEQRLNQLIKDKDWFISVLAHDLKNPFNSILGFSSLLLQNFETYTPDKIQNYLKIIHKMSKNTFHLLQDLLLWSMSLSGKLAINPGLIQFKQVCTEMITSFQGMTKDKNIIMFYMPESEIHFSSDLNIVNTEVMDKFDAIF